MNKKLHVGNLSYETTEDEQQKLFVEIGLWYPPVEVAGEADLVAAVIAIKSYSEY